MLAHHHFKRAPAAPPHGLNRGCTPVGCSPAFAMPTQASRLMALHRPGQALGPANGDAADDDSGLLDLPVNPDDGLDPTPDDGGGSQAPT